MAKTFYIGKSKLIISDELEDYNEFRNSFTPVADEAASNFEKLYREENHSLSDLVKKFDRQVMSALKPVMAMCSKMLFENGIYDIDQDTFLNQYCSRYVTVVESFQKFVDKYYEIQGDYDAARMYRGERKASRGMLVGGGFGLSGAAKGIATAGVINLTTGLMHSIANGIGNMFSNMECRKKMDAIFYDRNTLEELKDAVWESAFGMHYAYLDVVEERTGKRVHRFEPEDYKKAEAICKNIAAHQPDYESVQPAICQMLLAHPYEFNFYCLIIAQYGDENDDLQKIGEFFNINIDAIKIFIYDTIVRKIEFKPDIDMEEIISNAESYGVHFGVKKNVIKETSNRIRASYNEYLLKNSYYEKRKVYLEGTANRDKLDQLLDSCLNKCKTAANELFDNYLKGSEGCFSHKMIKENESTSKLTKYLFVISEDKLNQSFKFRISYTLIEYGRGKCIRISDVYKIRVENSCIIFNDTFRYRCSRVQQDKKLEEYLTRLVEHIQQSYRDVLLDVLSLQDLFDEAGREKLQRVKEYIKDNYKAIAKLYCDYNIYNDYDSEKLITVNNIAKKLEFYNVDRRSLNPILWFNIEHVAKKTEDSLIATEDFNEEKYRVDSDDYVLLTTKYLYFSNSNTRIELEKLSRYGINGKNIEITVDSSTLTIATCKYSDVIKLKILFDNIVKLLRGETAANIAYDPKNEDLEDQLSECNHKLNQMLLKRTKEDEREKFFKFIAVNDENEYFDSVVAEYIHNYSLGKFVKAEEILFFVKNTEHNKKEAVFFTLDNVAIVWQDSDNKTYIDAKRKFKDISYFAITEGKEDATGARRKKVAFNIQMNNNKYATCYESDFSIEFNRKALCEDISNEVLWTMQEALGIKAERNTMNFFDFVQREYNRCGLNTNDNNKFMFLRYSSGNFETKLKAATTNFAKLIANELPIFILDDSLLRGMTSGFVLTDKHLYHKDLPSGRMKLANIEEMQFNSGFLTAIIVITTSGQRYELSYISSIDSKNGLMDFLTTVILYIKEKPDCVLQGMKEKEKEIKEERQLIDEIKAIRRMPGVFLEVEKNIVSSAKQKCDNKGLTTGVQNTLMFKGYSQNFDVVYKRMMDTGYYCKPDNIEVPLMLFYKEADFTGGFVITSEAVYNCSGTFKKATYIPINKVKKVGCEDMGGNTTIYVQDKGTADRISLCKLPLEEGRIYLTIIRSFIEELAEANDEIVTAIDELYSGFNDIKDEYKAIDTMDSNELSSLLLKLKEYPELFSDELKVVENRIEEIDFEQYLSKTYPLPNEIDIDEVKRLLNEIKQRGFSSDPIKQYNEALNSRLLALEADELTALCNNISDLDKAKLLELSDTLKANYNSSELLKQYLTDIKRRLREIDKAEINELCKDIAQLSIQEAIALKEQLRPYDVILTKDYLEQIDMLINEKEEEELSRICAEYDSKNRMQLVAMIKEINSLGYKEGNTKGYISKLHSKIVAIDNETINNLCPDISQINIETAYQLLQHIEQMHIVGEVKKAFTDKLDAHIIQLINNDMAKYKKWLMDSGALTESLGIPHSTSDSINYKYIMAQTKYAGNISKYEVPILLNDTTMLGSGEEGFIVTNSNIYFKGKMTKAMVIPLKQVLRFDVEKKMLGSNVNLILVNGDTIPIPNKINKEVLANVLAILNQLVFDISSPNNVQPYEEHKQNSMQYATQSQGHDLVCGNCGSSYGSAHKFCTRCGNRLDTQSLQQPNSEIKQSPKIESDIVSDIGSVVQYIFNELNNTNINKSIGFVSIPGYMPKFEKKYSNACKAYANISNETPLLLFDTTIFESGKEGFIITDKNIYIKYSFEKPSCYPIAYVNRFSIMYESNSIRIGIELQDGKKQCVILSSSNEAEANDRCIYLNKVLSKVKDINTYTY